MSKDKKVIFIIGGARSGKSRFALEKASLISGKKAFIATAEALDEEMKERIERHRQVRKDDWVTFEEPLKVGNIIEDIKHKYRTILIDCLTLWLSNIIQKTNTREFNTKIVETEIEKLIKVIKSIKCSKGCNIFIVSNEVGMSIVPDNELARRYRDLLGFLNQKMSDISDEVYFLVAGQSLKIK